jgi:putative SOS response-associated peptidase YedK
MSRKFTLTECYELLQADPKTFRRWLKKAGIHEQVKSQISKADDRVKYLTQEQLEEIAALHERQLQLDHNTS